MFCVFTITIILLYRVERELLEAERKERQQLDLQRSIEAEKAALKQQQLQNKLALQQMAKKKPVSKYTFDMLNTDDDTDDESHPKAGRPPPPRWSVRKYFTARIICNYSELFVDFLLSPQAAIGRTASPVSPTYTVA